MFNRKPNRLPNQEIYQKNNWYFVTICIQNRLNIFGEIAHVAAVTPPPFSTPLSPPFSTPITQHQNNNILFTPEGKIASYHWFQITEYYSNVVLDEFVIMPNHIHGIIGFDGVPFSKSTGKPTNLSKIVKGYKKVVLIQLINILKNGVGDSENGGGVTAATTELLNTYKTIWQKSFYEHVIRDEKDLQKLKEYICNNPLKWELDTLNPSRSGTLAVPY